LKLNQHQYTNQSNKSYFEKLRELARRCFSNRLMIARCYNQRESRMIST